MFMQLLLKKTNANYQRSAKDTVSEKSSMLMRVDSSTNCLSTSHLFRLKTHMDGKGQKFKDLITIIFTCSAMGEKLRLTVIGHSKSPHSFWDTEVINSVHYYYKAWTTCTMFDAYLSWLSKKMISEVYTILLFIDNAPSHGHHSFSNIKLKLLPPNITSRLQALDARIITQVKALYKNCMLHNISFNVQHNIPISDAAKKIDIYTAIV